MNFYVFGKNGKPPPEKCPWLFFRYVKKHDKYLPLEDFDRATTKQYFYISIICNPTIDGTSQQILNQNYFHEGIYSPIEHKMCSIVSHRQLFPDQPHCRPVECIQEGQKTSPLHFYKNDRSSLCFFPYSSKFSHIAFLHSWRKGVYANTLFPLSHRIRSYHYLTLSLQMYTNPATPSASKCGITRLTTA